MVVLSNQGNYITIIVKSILSSMFIGAALAIIVLAIFLRDVKPTLVVGFSIPLSVLFAVVLMYFTGMDRQRDAERHDAGRPVAGHRYAGG